MIEVNVYLRFGTGFARLCRNTRNLSDDERNLTSGGNLSICAATSYYRNCSLLDDGEFSRNLTKGIESFSTSIRYRTGSRVPPPLAATIHCSPSPSSSSPLPLYKRVHSLCRAGATARQGNISLSPPLSFLVAKHLSLPPSPQSAWSKLIISSSTSSSSWLLRLSHWAEGRTKRPPANGSTASSGGATNSPGRRRGERGSGE